MAENSECKKCQQNLLNYVSHNLSPKVEKNKEKEKEKGDGKSEGKSSADKPSANSGLRQQRPKQGAQGPGNQSTVSSSGTQCARGGLPPTNIKQQSSKTKGNTPSSTLTP